MSAVLKPKFSLTPELRAALDRVAAEVQIEHELRMDVCNTIPLKTRGRRVKKQPKTAVLVAAIERNREKVRARQLLSLMKPPK